jgi:hypothetical protein
MALKAPSNTTRVVKKWHTKNSLAVMITIFASVGGITWALVNAQQTNQDETQLPPANMPKLMIHEEIRTAAISYINQQHPETAQFTTNSS